MSNKAELPPIVDDELLARFVLFSNWIRQDQIPSDAFIPYPYRPLSYSPQRLSGLICANRTNRRR